MKMENLFVGWPEQPGQELFQELLATPHFRLERIRSEGHATQPGTWYDQEGQEWVILVRGTAGLLFEGEPAPRRLVPGHHLLIPAHARHRVEWTSRDEPAIWLALHFGP